MICFAPLTSNYPHMNPLLNASHRKLFGISLLAVAALAACGGSDDEPERTPASLQLEKIGGYSAGQFLKSAAEIPALMQPPSALSWSMHSQASWMCWI